MSAAGMRRMIRLALPSESAVRQDARRIERNGLKWDAATDRSAWKSVN